MVAKNVRQYICPTCGVTHHLFKAQVPPTHGDACLTTLAAELRAMKAILRHILKEGRKP